MPLGSCSLSVDVPVVSPLLSSYDCNRPDLLQSPGTPKPQKCILKSERPKKGLFGPFNSLLGPFFRGVENGIFRTLKCTFGVSGLRGSVAGRGDWNPIMTIMMNGHLS